MSNGVLKTQAQFLADNGLSRSQLHYLDKLGRGPEYIYLGSRKTVSPEAEAKWREEMRVNPVRGSLRLAAEAVKAAAAAAAAPADVKTADVKNAAERDLYLARVAAAARNSKTRAA